MGYQLDNQGNISSEQQPINLAYDPKSKLYGGKYSSFHFDRSGKLYGVQKTTNPLTGKVVERTVPLYQVAIGSFANPSGLKKSGNTTFIPKKGHQELLFKQMEVLTSHVVDLFSLQE